jgi:hypothetical protein
MCRAIKTIVARIAGVVIAQSAKALIRQVGSCAFRQCAMVIPPCYSKNIASGMILGKAILRFRAWN